MLAIAAQRSPSRYEVVQSVRELMRWNWSMMTVSAEELKRLKKRFMKLDKDGSGSIDKDEFLQIPQIANNPLASRMIAIFDEESVSRVVSTAEGHRS